MRPASARPAPESLMRSTVALPRIRTSLAHLKRFQFRQKRGHIGSLFEINIDRMIRLQPGELAVEPDLLHMAAYQDLKPRRSKVVRLPDHPFQIP